MWAEIVAAAIGAAIGAAATVWTGLLLARRAREEEERTSSQLLGAALDGFIAALNPLVVLSDEEIDTRRFADVRAELQSAHDEIERVGELVEHLLGRDRGFSARALLGILGILNTLRREHPLWEAERRAISRRDASREVLKVHLKKLRASATKMDRHAEEALASIGRSRPAVARATVAEGADTITARAQNGANTSSAVSPSSAPT